MSVFQLLFFLFFFTPLLECLRSCGNTSVALVTCSALHRWNWHVRRLPKHGGAAYTTITSDHDYKNKTTRRMLIHPSNIYNLIAVPRSVVTVPLCLYSAQEKVARPAAHCDLRTNIPNSPTNLRNSTKLRPVSLKL